MISAFGPRSLKKGDGKTRVGAADSAKDNPLIAKLFVALVLKNVFADKNRGESLLAQSNSIGSTSAPAASPTAPARGDVKASLTPKARKPVMTREDLAEFMVTQLESDEWVRKSPLIGY